MYIDADALLEFLRSHDITYQRVDHPPVYTCDEARVVTPELPGAETKNLFLCDGKGRRHFLVTVRPDAQVDFKALGTALGVGGLRLASSERLARHLALEPGSVSLLGVINDTEQAVEVVIDENLWREEAFQCHPLVNTSTIALTKEGLTRFFEVRKHEPHVLRVPTRR